MMSFFDRPPKSFFAPKTLDDVRIYTRILVIDDQKPSLVEDLEREGWRVRYMEDLDRYESTELIDASIVCLDIMGIGQKLRCDNGIGLVKGIKEKYPGKKILLYSSRRKQDIFDESIDLVDKRVFKDGQPYAFIKAIEELAIHTFDWEQCVKETYARFKKQFGAELTEQEFEKRLRKSVRRNGQLDVAQVAKFACISVEIAGKIAAIVKLLWVPS
jgi:hypothetical protein